VRAVEPVTGYDRPHETIAAGVPNTRRGRFSKLPTTRWRTARTAQSRGQATAFASVAAVPERRLSTDHPRVEQVSTRIVFMGSPATCANCGDEIETGSRQRRLLFRTGTDTTSSFEEFAACDMARLASFVAAW